MVISLIGPPSPAVGRAFIFWRNKTCRKASISQDLRIDLLGSHKLAGDVHVMRYLCHAGIAGDSACHSGVPFSSSAACACFVYLLLPIAF